MDYLAELDQPNLNGVPTEPQRPFGPITLNSQLATPTWFDAATPSTRQDSSALDRPSLIHSRGVSL